MPDMNTLKITYLSEIPFKVVSAILLASTIAIITYVVIDTIKLFANKDKGHEEFEPSQDPILGATALYILSFCCLFFVFKAPYADISVKVIPNMDVREFDMNHSRDFFKKNDEYYFIKTIETSLCDKGFASRDQEGLSDLIKWSIKRSVSGTREGDK